VTLKTIVQKIACLQQNFSFESYFIQTLYILMNIYPWFLLLHWLRTVLMPRPWVQFTIKSGQM